MRFTHLTIQNFLSFGNGTASINLAGRGLTLIEGINEDDPSATSNGSGKSSIVDALLWALYGITTRGYEGDEVIHLITSKNCLVTVTMEQDGVPWVVRRSRKHDHYKTSLRLIHAGVDISAGTIAQTQEQIDRALGMQASSFAATVIFGQTQAYRFSQLTDGEQKAILDEALGTEQYALACAVARDEAQKLRRDLEQLEDAQKWHSDAVAKAQKDIDLYTEETKEFDDKQQAHRASYRARRKALKSQIASTELPDLTELQAKRDEWTLRRDEAQKTVVDASSKGYPLAKEIGSLESEGLALENAIEKAKEKRGTNCEMCDQPITEATNGAHVAEMEKQLKKIERRYKKLQAQMAHDVETFEAAQREERALTEKVKGVSRKIEEGTRIHTKVKHWLEESGNLLNAIKELKSRVNPFIRLTENARFTLKNEKDLLKTVRSKIPDAEKAIAEADFWVAAFGAKGLRSLLLDNALPFLNKQAKTYSEIISDGRLKIEFKTVSTLKSGKSTDRFEVLVTNEFGAPSYKGLSAGEKAKIDICVGLSLQALIAANSATHTNLAFFDEPFESLDATAIERVMTLLSVALGSRESLFIITHNDTLKSYFPSTITVKKHKGRSVLV